MPLLTEIEPAPGYRLQRRLGVGGFAEVWEATAPDGAGVALKFINARNHDAAMLRGEVRVLRSFAAVDHPNLIRLHDVFASSHFLVLCMELADGNLDELRQAYLAQTGANIPPDHVLDLLEQAANGLDFLAGLRLPGFNHTATGMQHCDVKPTNLLLLDDTVKIADFGLCAGMGQRTHRRGVRGTPPFAAPELYQGRVCAQTDQYALAVTWCDLIGGRRLFTNTVGADGKPFLAVDLTKVRASEVHVLARALNTDPTRRYPNCQAFVVELRKALESAQPRAVPRSRPLLSQARGRGETRAAVKGTK